MLVKETGGQVRSLIKRKCMKNGPRVNQAVFERWSLYHVAFFATSSSSSFLFLERRCLRFPKSCHVAINIIKPAKIP
ncbi:unnamed protein product [Parascedosporium putredinis]|uniref:Uncharacterized protein n=1 Tax=Parascedosporium putredinis TaxID=1442378 RepID=A0A9P1GVY7_9PEZI|nr:unnamed protein product [Parascedosporium putredinis]CAI7988088.1 unnamed protein product [Parascedosporium putredinis]